MHDTDDDLRDEQAFWRALAPETEEHRLAAMALWRPAPRETGLSRTYLERRHGRQPVTYPHDILAAILAPTYGLLIYREELGEIVQAIYPYVDARRLLRLLRHPHHTAQEMERGRFVTAAQATGQFSAPEAEQLFDWLLQWAPVALARTDAEKALRARLASAKNPLTF